MSKIEWTGRTWNPTTGCSLVSPGCTNCYAMKMAARLEAMGQAKYAGTTKKVNGKAVWTGKLNLADDALSIPLKTKKPTTWFVNSMSDLFHEAVPFEFIDKVFAVMALTSRHTYQILTKRPERMAEYVLRTGKSIKFLEQPAREMGWSLQFDLQDGRGLIGLTAWPLPNVWLGTSCENQKTADERIPHLLKCPAAIRFLSCEPLLESIDLRAVDVTGNGHERPVDWVIVGGESGPGARPCNIDWIRSIVQQCAVAGVACFVKQLGAKPYDPSWYGDGTTKGSAMQLNDPKGGDPLEWSEDLRIRQMPQPVEARP